MFKGPRTSSCTVRDPIVNDFCKHLAGNPSQHEAFLEIITHKTPRSVDLEIT